MTTSDLCPRVMLDGVLVDAGAARISPLSDGFMFGHGLFETIKVLRGRPVFWEKHAARLEGSAGELSLAVASGLRARCQQVIEANTLTNGVLKVVIFQGESGAGELILARTFVYPDSRYETGFRLKTFSDARTGDGVGRLKTLNYLKNIRARNAARAAGFDEALFVDANGAALEGAATTLFVVKKGRVFTPAVSSGILPGIARSVVLGLLDEKQREETAVSAAMLHDADEVFVTNALLGVMPVSRVDERVYRIGADSLTRNILTAYHTAEQSSIGR